MDIKGISNKYKVRRLLDSDVSIVYELCKKNELYYQYCPPFVTEQSILDDMSALPPGKQQDEKFYIGFFENQKLIAVLDLIEHFPDDKTAFIGFFMTSVTLQNTGVGTEIITDLCEHLRNNGTDYIRLAWVQGNPQAEHFWKKNGFLETGITQDMDDYTVVVAERNII